MRESEVLVKVIQESGLKDEEWDLLNQLYELSFKSKEAWEIVDMPSELRDEFFRSFKRLCKYFETGSQKRLMRKTVRLYDRYKRHVIQSWLCTQKEEKCLLGG